MNKNWLTLIIIAIITLLSVIGYQFYISITGQNTGFSKTVMPINPDLGTSTLNAIQTLDLSAPVRNEALNNK
jgi:hypothetical protein